MKDPEITAQMQAAADLAAIELQKLIEVYNGEVPGKLIVDWFLDHFMKAGYKNLRYVLQNYRARFKLPTSALPNPGEPR